MRKYGDISWGRDEHGLDRLIEQDYTPICVELVRGAQQLPAFTHPENAIYVFGPEDGDVPKGIRHICHNFVIIPGKGCLNLAAAVNVVLYDRAAKNSHRQ
jgi:tRNA(Leu) C34 or U34 (ribose-2'-O)-methylase TrmL